MVDYIFHSESDSHAVYNLSAVRMHRLSDRVTSSMKLQGHTDRLCKLSG